MHAHVTGDSTCLTLSTAILLYEGEQKNSEQGYVTIHPVRRGDDPKQKERLTVGPGVPASRIALAALLRSLMGSAEVMFIAPNVLFSAPGLLVFWVPPAPRHVWFKSSGALGNRHGTVPLPGCIFYVTESDWRVWAVKGKERPTPTSELFVAPFYNVWDGGKICTGTVTRPAGAQFSNPDSHIEAFFRSNFTHPNVNSKELTKYKGGCISLWKALLGGSLTKFPEASLVPMNKVLGAHVTELLSAASKGDE